MSVLFTQCPGDTVQTGTGKVDSARKFTYTKAARSVYVYCMSKATSFQRYKGVRFTSQQHPKHLKDGALVIDNVLCTSFRRPLVARIVNTPIMSTAPEFLRGNGIKTTLPVRTRRVAMHLSSLVIENCFNFTISLTVNSKF